MGELSTSVWSLDPAWTCQLENDDAQEADNTINARPKNMSAQKPVLPSIDMPPKTRSQTTRSHPTPTLAPLEEELERLDIEDVLSSSDHTSSSSYDPARERHEPAGVAVNSTPKYRKPKNSSVSSKQKELALEADPNEGRCLLTNRPTPVDSCHVVADSTKTRTLRQLGYVWGMVHGFHQDTRHNLFHLRVDWHRLFDHKQWMLIPEAKELAKLKRIYLENGKTTSDPTKLYEQPPFKYHVLPAPTLNEPITRFPDANKRNHTTHFPPFLELGALESHIYPHFVVFNTGEKLQDFGIDDLLDMAAVLARIIPPGDALEALTAIRSLYRAWTTVKLPGETTIDPSDRPNPPIGEHQSDHSQHEPHLKRQGLRSATRSQGQGSQGASGEYAGGQQRAVVAFQPPDDADSSSVTDDTAVEDDTDWIEYIHKWQKHSDGAIGKSGVLNDSSDEQLAAYVDEHARTPPSAGFWDSWKPTWDDEQSRYPYFSDRSRFSSNDWAVFKDDVYLTKLRRHQ